jgi:hypothetical protein
MFRRFNDTWGQPDVLLYNGDHVTHGLSWFSDDSPGDYNILLQSLGELANMFSNYFPNSMILPTIGNNDNKYHDSATTEL